MYNSGEKGGQRLQLRGGGWATAADRFPGTRREFIGTRTRVLKVTHQGT